MASKFTHLHVHSHYSLLNALPQVPDLVKAAKDAGMETLALTDNGNLYGAIEFYQKCKKAGLKPIIGIDAYVAPRTRRDKEHKIDNKRIRLVLLAKNREGYKNLIKLVTDSHLEGFYYKPRIDTELMQKYNAGLIAIIPSFTGEVPLALKMKDYEKAENAVAKYKKIYGAENVFLEITRHPEIPGHEELMGEIAAFAKKTGAQICAAHDVYYLKPEDRKARDTLLSVQTSIDWSDKATGFEESEEDFSFISPEQAEKYFADMPEALLNTRKIADACNLEIELGKWYFPDIKPQPGKTHNQTLRDWVYEGFERRKLEKTPELVARVEYELKVICDKGYAPYFLTVADLLKFAHENHILTTIRGSVAGSLVTYLVGITNVNPIEYKLPFERFLNAERPSAPDIDMDYADNRRDEMIAYAREKYGSDKVAQIGTFGTMMARGSVRDTARALGFPYDLGDRIAKLIPMGSQGFPMSIERAMEEVSELKGFYDKEQDVKTIIDMAKKIEGCARHISVHAAGVVISPDPLVEHVPMQFDPKGEGKLITQYDMHAVGEDGVGLLKFDFLGIRNLAILADAVSLVEKIEGKKIDIENIPLGDKKTFEMLAKGETIGLFQLNGSGMTRYLKELRPTTIHDINAMVALYRPGPMESIPQYIERKHNPMLVEYLDPRMKDILDQSYGVLTYQDDVMMIAIKLAGYSWLEADKLRKAMGKKIPAEMEAQKEKLKSGLIKNGMIGEKADRLWKLIEPFAAYGFNKAHAASYGKVAYQTSYMKANFPAIYMAAVLTAESGDVEKIAEIIAECKRMGIDILPPDINESFAGFTVIKGDKGNSGKDKIRFGLLTVKNFGEGIGNTIITERKRLPSRSGGQAGGGKFKSLADFLDRIKDRNLNKKSLEALIKCGAMDALGERGEMLGNLEGLLAYNKEKNMTAGQDSLFGNTAAVQSLRLEKTPPAEAKDKLTWEKELLGLYVSGHPLDQFKEKLAGKIPIEKIKIQLKEGMVGVISGIVDEMKPIVTKNGENMAFIKITDMSGSMEVVAFPRVLKEYQKILVPESCVSIKGRISHRNGQISMLAEAVKAL